MAIDSHNRLAAAAAGAVTERARVGWTPGRRLVVLVPEGPFDEAALARQVWALAGAGPRRVLYLGLSRGAADEALARRRLASLAALTRDDGLSVSTRLATEPNWLRAARAIRQPGDELVCAAGQTAPRWGLFGRRPLSVVLAAGLGLPVHEITGLAVEPAPGRSRARAWLSFWLGAAAIVAFFFWLDVRLGQLPDNPARMALVALVVVAEFALLGWWARPAG
ncbi:MAG: hypothetical protein IT318_24085 [Anaerolineales bacterium]|nr:hypothetical protein [Anaerolineales bacterium]